HIFGHSALPLTSEFLQSRRIIADAVAVSLLAGLDGHGQLLFLPGNRILAAVDQLGGRFPQLGSTAPDELFALIRLRPDVILAFAGPFPKILPGFLTGSWGQQHSDRDPNSQAHYEIRYSAILLGHVRSFLFLNLGHSMSPNS